jgi:crotonobetainyl-CoA:carnitine CoA-transferase CaiB-like acyl-CoA transferase
MSTATPPLSGLRVIDFSEQVPGPNATRLLTALGCDVVKVERPDGGDRLRHRPAMFEAENRGKRSLAIDLKAEQGREVALSLVANADVVVEGYRPGVMDRLGLGFADVQKVNPSVVYVSISGYGAHGPYRDLPGHDFQYLSLVGAIPRPADGQAGAYVPTTLPVADLGSSLYAIVGILIALLDKARDPEGFTGRHLDVSMADCALAMMEPRLAEALQSESTAAALSRPGYGIYRTADDRYVTIGALEDHFWERLTTALELPELQVEDLRTFAGRRERVQDIESVLRPRVEEYDRDDLVRLLIKHDVPVAPLNDFHETVDDPHFIERGSVLTHPNAPMTRVSEWPVALDPFTDRTRLTPAPAVGQDSRSVLEGAGLRAEAIDALIAANVVHQDGQQPLPPPISESH